MPTASWMGNMETPACAPAFKLLSRCQLLTRRRRTTKSISVVLFIKGTFTVSQCSRSMNNYQTLTNVG
jgi:hypothetical protein